MTFFGFQQYVEPLYRTVIEIDGRSLETVTRKFRVACGAPALDEEPFVADLELEDEIVVPDNQAEIVDELLSDDEDVDDDPLPVATRHRVFIDTMMIEIGSLI